jgi:cell division septum initiation protein DivIVA
MQNDDIETIIDKINRLTIQQQQLTEQIAQLTNEVQNRTVSKQTPANTSTGDSSKAKKRPIQVGDKVRVKNPRKSQPDTGTVHSFTKSGLFARVKLSNDTIINRAPRNLTRLET